MLHSRILLVVCSVLCLILALGSPASAIPVAKTYVGTWSGTPGGANPGGLAQGGKFVIETNYDTADIVAISDGRFPPSTVYHVPLTDVPGAGGAVNTYELSIPMEGFGTIETQIGPDHFPLPGFAPTAEIQFFNPLGTQFRGFEFESQFLTGNLVFEQFTTDPNISGTIVTNSNAQILDGSAGFATNITSRTVDVLSDSPAPAGGQQNPGVFLSEAVEVIAEAGASPLVYDATTLSVTTNAGTEQVVDTVDPIIPGQVRTAPSGFDETPRQADNDLGAARSDGEDFLTFDWTVDGTGVVGTETGTRLNRVVTSDGVTPQYENDGTRTVDDVNISVAIENSGLANTTDSVTWDVQVTEAITGSTDTDSVTVSYANALPSIVNASATAQVLDIQFDLAVADLDLAINSLIPGFEDLIINILVDTTNEDAFFAALLANATIPPGGSQQLVTHANLLSQFGLGMHTFRVDVTDFAGASVFQEFDFTVLEGAPQPIPEPGTMALLATGLVFLGMRSRLRRPRKRD